MKHRKNALQNLLISLMIVSLCGILVGCENNKQPEVSDGGISVEIEAMDSTDVKEEEKANSPGENGPSEKAESQAEVKESSNKSVDKTSDPAAANPSPEAATAQNSTPVDQSQPIASTQQQSGETGTQTSSSGSSYEQIFNEYSQKLADYYNTAKGELQSEATSGKSIDVLATSCSNKVSRLAEISTEGVNKMADLCVKRGGSASEYMNYGTKLESVYMDYGTKLESVYMSGAMNSQTKAVEDTMKDLGISSDISGQYSEEMNKAMDQYNDELNKAMDDYNQQVQDMLKQYGL